MSSWRIEALNKRHDRGGFNCGEQSLDDFLKKAAVQNARKDMSRTYVAVAEGSDVIAGCYTISSGTVSFNDLPEEQSRRLPKYPIPTVNIGRLAVSKEFQGQKLGQILLMDALAKAMQVSERVGVYAVTVDALKESARDFYLKFGFLSLQDDPLHLFLPMATVRQLWEEE